MIQRIQTIYMLTASSLLLLCFYRIPIDFCISNIESINNFSPTYFSKNIFYLCFTIVITFFSIVSYKNLNRQIKLNYLLIFSSVILILVEILLNNVPSFIFSNFAGCERNWTILVLYFFSIIFYFLSIKNIKKDDELLKSVNRLR